MPEFDCPPVRCYLTLREVPPRFGRFYLWRSPGRVLVAVQPGTARVELVDFLVTHCTLTEQNAYRWHTGQGPVGTPIHDWMLTGVMTAVLPELRLPTEALSYGLDRDWPSVGLAG